LAITSIKRYNVPDNGAQAARVFAEHGDFIRSVIRGNVKNRALCEDIYQDFFLFLITKPIPGDVQNVRAFLHKLVSDNIKDTFRRIDLYRARIHRYAYQRRDITEEHPEIMAIKSEELERIFELIKKSLPAKEALAVLLRYKDHFNVREVAERLGIKPRSVSRYVSVGLKKVSQVVDVNRWAS